MADSSVQQSNAVPLLCSFLPRLLFGLLPLSADVLERDAGFCAAVSLPPKHSCIPFETSLLLPPATQLTSPSSKAANGFPSPQPDGLLSTPSLPGCETLDPAAQPFFPILGRASGGFQLQIVHFLECVRSGYGHGPKFSLLICKMGLIKYVICVWHTTDLPSDPLFVSLSFCTHSAAKLIFLEWMSLHHSLRG